MQPRNASAWSGLGAARMRTGDTSGAVEAYRRAVSLSPRTLSYHVALGRAFAAAGDRTHARAAFEHVLSVEPGNTGAQAGLRSL